MDEPCLPGFPLPNQQPLDCSHHNLIKQEIKNHIDQYQFYNASSITYFSRKLRYIKDLENTTDALIERLNGQGIQFYFLDLMYLLRTARNRTKYIALLLQEQKHTPHKFFIPETIQSLYLEMRIHSFKLQKLIDKEITQLETMTPSFLNERMSLTHIHSDLIHRASDNSHPTINYLLYKIRGLHSILGIITYRKAEMTFDYTANSDTKSPFGIEDVIYKNIVP